VRVWLPEKAEPGRRRGIAAGGPSVVRAAPGTRAAEDFPHGGAVPASAPPGERVNYTITRPARCRSSVQQLGMAGPDHPRESVLPLHLGVTDELVHSGEVTRHTAQGVSGRHELKV
jgi:hypothetical protein